MSGEDWGFPGTGPALYLHGQPWNCHGAFGCVAQPANVLQRAYTESQDLVEIYSLATLDLFDFNQFMSFPQEEPGRLQSMGLQRVGHD